MNLLKNYIDIAESLLTKNQLKLEPWEIIQNFHVNIDENFNRLNDSYIIKGEIAYHPSVIIEKGVTLKGRIILHENVKIGAHAYLRGPIIIGNHTIIGPGVEIKNCIIFHHTAIAHFNFIGDSIIGNHVNFEAGSITANHYNERQNKRITVNFNDQSIYTNCTKFGSLIGDHSKIGANAVLSPGTILTKETIVNRLQLIQQNH